MIISIAVTCKNKKEAEKIAQILLKKKLVACANIISNLESIYWWQGKIIKDKEVLVIFKSLERNSKKIISEIKKLHSYQVPVITVEKIKTNKEAKEWLRGVII